MMKEAALYFALEYFISKTTFLLCHSQIRVYFFNEIDLNEWYRFKGSNDFDMKLFKNLFVTLMRQRKKKMEGIFRRVFSIIS